MINQVMYGSVTLIDLSIVTVTPETLAQGVTAYDRTGTKITGTMAFNGSTEYNPTKKGYNQIFFGERVLVDISDSTVTPSTLAKGAIAYDRAGNVIVGTAELPTNPLTVNVNDMNYDIEEGWTWSDFVYAYSSDGYTLGTVDDLGNDGVLLGGTPLTNTTTGAYCLSSEPIDTNYSYYA